MKRRINYSSLFLFLVLMTISVSKINAQVGSGCVKCIENSTNCDAEVIIDFWCNGIPATNNTSTFIPGKTTFCPTWQSFYPNPCNPCDMVVTLVSLDAQTVLPPNVVSISSPGPVAPDVNTYVTPNSNCIDMTNMTVPNMPQLYFDGNLFWIFY